MLQDNLNQRKQQYEAQLGMVAREELSIERRLVELKAQGASLEGAIQEISNVLRDINTDAVIDTAKEQHNE